MAGLVILLAVIAAVVTGLPHDPVLRRLDDGLRHQYVEGADGAPHLVDLWVKTSDVANVARYHPESQNIYHLFTRQNTQISQPLLHGNTALLGASNFDPERRTIVLIHGWQDSVTADFNTVLVPAYLQAENVNVIVVDWYSGGGVNYASAVINTPISGEAVARFISWLNQSTGARVSQYHLVGHGLGGHQAGIISRNLDRLVPYVTALDPAFPGWLTNNNKFQPYDAIYTEVIHTNAGVEGYAANLGHVDFYPNGGIDMPGCITNRCDHHRAFFYMAESVTDGGFTGNRCSTYISAMAGTCILSGTLRMGGIQPKTGSTGIFYLRTNIFPPFSRD